MFNLVYDAHDAKLYESWHGNLRFNIWRYEDEREDVMEIWDYEGQIQKLARMNVRKLTDREKERLGR